MQWIKSNKHGWISLVVGVGLILTAGFVYSASPEKPPQDALGTHALEWDQLSRVNFPLLTDKPRKTARLTLENCIRRALAHNLDIRISRLALLGSGGRG